MSLEEFVDLPSAQDVKSVGIRIHADQVTVSPNVFMKVSLHMSCCVLAIVSYARRRQSKSSSNVSGPDHVKTSPAYLGMAFDRPARQLRPEGVAVPQLRKRPHPFLML